jgi:hypothetical protein
MIVRWVLLALVVLAVVIGFLWREAGPRHMTSDDGPAEP